MTTDKSSNLFAHIPESVLERKLQVISETVLDAIISADGKGCVVYVNGSAATMFGYSRDELIGMPLTIIMPERYRNLHETGIRRFSATGQTKIIGQTIEVAGLRKDGTEFPVEISLTNWNSDGNQFFTAVIRDISGRKNAELELQRWTAELERSNSDLQQFAYIASHDLQEPLRMIASYIQALQEDYAGKFDENGEEYMRIIVESSLRMRKMIEDLLEYSRVGYHLDKMEDVDCSKLLVQVCELMNDVTTKNCARITHNHLPVVTAHGVLLARLFQNLLSNALKFRSEAQPEIHISAADRGSHWEFSFNDNGIGIDMKFKDKVFVVFQRLNQHSRFPGTGIGLALCKKIVENHGGKIWFESEPGKGATFFFTIAKQKS